MCECVRETDREILQGGGQKEVGSGDRKLRGGESGPGI